MNWYFTFGFAHTTKNDESLAHRYVKIVSDDWWEARQKFMRVRGTVWSFQYSEVEFLPQIKEYGLTEISLEDCA